MPRLLGPITTSPESQHLHEPRAVVGGHKQPAPLPRAVMLGIVKGRLSGVEAKKRIGSLGGRHLGHDGIEVVWVGRIEQRRLHFSEAVPAQGGPGPAGTIAGA